MNPVEHLLIVKRGRKKIEEMACANAHINWVNEPLDKEPFKMTMLKCNAEKRNGSKYCQECSDKHGSNT